MLLDLKAGGLNDEDEDWETRLGHRMRCYAFVRRSPDYIDMERLRSNGFINASQRPRSPDPEDRSVSKRAWEKQVMRWRRALKDVCEQHQSFLASPHAAFTPLPAEIHNASVCDDEEVSFAQSQSHETTNESISSQSNDVPEDLLRCACRLGCTYPREGGYTMCNYCRFSLEQGLPCCCPCTGCDESDNDEGLWATFMEREEQRLQVLSIHEDNYERNISLSSSSSIELPSAHDDGGFVS